MQKHIPVMIELHDKYAFRKNYPILYLEDLDSIIDFLSGVALSQGKVLTRHDNDHHKWVLVKPDRFSAREMSKKD
jgi:predicted alpha/beta superfamily hydrolase